MSRLLVHVEGQTEENLRQRVALPAPHAVRVVDGQRATAGKRAPTGSARRNQAMDVCSGRNRQEPSARTQNGS